MSKKNLVWHLVGGLFRQLDEAGGKVITRLNISVYTFNLLRAMLNGDEEQQAAITEIEECIQALREGYQTAFDRDDYIWDSADRINFENLLDFTNYKIDCLINEKIPISESTIQEMTVGRARSKK